MMEDTTGITSIDTIGHDDYGEEEEEEEEDDLVGMEDEEEEDDEDEDDDDDDDDEEEEEEEEDENFYDHNGVVDDDLNTDAIGGIGDMMTTTTTTTRPIDYYVNNDIDMNINPIDMNMNDNNGIDDPNNDENENNDENNDWNTKSLNLQNVGLIIGRQEEYDMLLQAYQRIQQPEEQSRVILIHGESGSGKTALVQQFQQELLSLSVTGSGGGGEAGAPPVVGAAAAAAVAPPLATTSTPQEEEQEQFKYQGVGTTSSSSSVMTRPFFVTGKFDQNYTSARPYSAIVDALTELVYCIQTYDTDTTRSSSNNGAAHGDGDGDGTMPSLVETLRNQLYDSLDDEAQILITIIPAMEQILDGLEWNMSPSHHTHHHSSMVSSSPSTGSGSGRRFNSINSNNTANQQQQQQQHPATRPSTFPSSNVSTSSSSSSSSPLPPNPYALKRIMDILRIFLRFVCTPEHPVVLFLDDLQWSDDASRYFLSSIAGDVRSTNLLVLGAIREGGGSSSSNGGGGDNNSENNNSNNDHRHYHHNDTNDNNNNNNANPLSTFQQQQRRTAFVLTTEDPRSQLFTTRIELGPFDEELVNDMISKLVELTPIETQELSTVIYAKTGGNPYYVIQYMEMLVREYLVTYEDIANLLNAAGDSMDEDDRELLQNSGVMGTEPRWEWELDAVKSRTEMSESLLEIISDKIVVLSNDVQDVLMVASCLGYSFDAELLESIVVSQGLLTAPGGSTEPAGGIMMMDDGGGIIGTNDGGIGNDNSTASRFHKALESAMRERLIEQAPNDSNHYYFTHDRVHQATMELIPPPPRKSQDESLQLKVGQLVLMMSRAIPDKKDMLYVGVDLVTRHSLLVTTTGLTASTTTSKQIELARLLLEAALQACNKVAYTMAADYADRALQLLFLLGDTRWTDPNLYQLTLDLYNLSAEMNYAHGTPTRLDQSEASVLEILRQSRTLREKFRAYNVHLGLFNARRDFTGALREGNALLKLLGTPLPSKVRMSGVLFAFVTTKRLLQRKKAQELLNLPTLTNDTSLHVMRILNFMTLFAWSSGQPETLVLAILKMIKISIQEGVCEYSPFAFASYSSMLGGMGDYATAFEYGALALDLVERPGMRGGYARTVEVVHFAVYHLKYHIRDSLNPVLKAYHIGMETGDVDFAAMCLCCHTCLSLHAGTSLHHLEHVLVGYVDFFREYRQDAVRFMVIPWLQLTLNLMGKSNNPLVLTGNVMNEDDFEAEVQSSNYVAAAAHASYARLILYYVFGDLDLAEAERKLQVQYSEVDKLSFMKCFNVLFCGLTCLGLARKDKAKRKVHQRKARGYIKELETYSKVGSANCVPMLALLEAEFATMLGNKGSFMDTYDAAIGMCSRSGFRLMKGIACERAAEYAMSSGDLEMAGEYVHHARKVFHDFGAEGKLRQMEQRYSRVPFPNTVNTAATTATTIPGRIISTSPTTSGRKIKFSD